MINLRIDDFEKIKTSGMIGFYLKHQYIGPEGIVYEIDLEPCRNGFDVGNYQVSGWDIPNLTEMKMCTEISLKNPLNLLDSLSRAIALASILKTKYMGLFPDKNKIDT